MHLSHVIKTQITQRRKEHPSRKKIPKYKRQQNVVPLLNLEYLTVGTAYMMS